jgi:hypothetical protein
MQTICGLHQPSQFPPYTTFSFFVRNKTKTSLTLATQSLEMEQTWKEYFLFRGCQICGECLILHRRVVNITTTCINVHIVTFLLWYASCCVSIRQYLFTNWSVYTTTFAIKQIKHYCANICFLYACVVIPLHVSTLFIGSSSGVFNTGFSYWITMNSYCIYG